MLIARFLASLGLLAALCVGLALASSIQPPTRLASSTPTGESPNVRVQEASVSAIAADPFGIAHISAVNAQSPTYNTVRYNQATTAGGQWNRWVFYWHEIESTPGVYDYGPQNDTVNHDVAAGFRYKIDAVLMGTPSWASATGLNTSSATPPPPRVGQRGYGMTAADVGAYDGPSSAIYPPQHLEYSVFNDGDVPGPGKTINQNNYWARFVYNTVLAYKDRVRHWEIWNEPDFCPQAPSWFGFWAGNQYQYYRLLKVAYLAAKAADPNAVIVMGGLAYWQQGVCYPGYTFFDDVLARTKGDSAGAANNYFFDVTAWHWYNRSSQSYDMVRDTQEKLASYGLAAKPIWLNESGMPAWNDPPGPGSPYFGSGTMTEQASYILQALAFGLAAGVERQFAFQEYDDGNGEAFGLFRNSGAPRPSYYAYQMATRYFGGTTSATLSWTGPNNKIAKVAATTSSGSKVTALWNYNPMPEQISVPSAAASALLLSQPTEASLYGSQQTIYPSGSQYAINLPGATNANGMYTGDYIVGGLVSLIVENASAPLPTPTPLPPPPPPLTGLLKNGGFELTPSLTGWTAGGDKLPSVSTSFKNTGSSAALLGGILAGQSGNSTLSQVFKIPALSDDLDLKFSYFFNSKETADRFQVYVLDQSNTRHDLMDTTTSPLIWVPMCFDLSPFRGQQITLVFNVWQSPTSKGSSVYLDDVKLWPFSTTLPAVVR